MIDVDDDRGSRWSPSWPRSASSSTTSRSPAPAAPSSSGCIVDREGGVDLDTIGSAAEAISPSSTAPQVAAALPGPYALEVSSPGLERPLRRPEHFAPRRRRHDLGQDRRGRRVRGVVVEADDDAFELALDDGTHRTNLLRRRRPGSHGLRVGGEAKKKQ